MEVISVIISSVFLIASSVLVMRSKIPKQTIESQKELIEAYEKRIKNLEDLRQEDHKQHVENAKAIAELQGQLKAYKEIPLKKLATAVEKTEQENVLKFQILQQIAQTQEEILRLIKENNEPRPIRTEI